MIFEVLVALLIILIIYRKKIIKIADIPLRYPLVIFLSFALQFSIVYFGGKEVNFFLEYGSVIYVASFLLLFWALYHNLHIPGMKIVFTGIFCNFMAITMNGGAMPVSSAALRTAGLNSLLNTLAKGLWPTHQLMSQADNLLARVFGDFIPIPPPHPRPRVISIGDIIMTVGIIVVMVMAVRSKGESPAVVEES
ncbi:MAG: DUF5317 domain-containing protein [Halanaerobium sp.]|nr:DUF5317 domain-containing protein [Halanaerobium sp.]